jgi:hypothetical protein
VIQLIAVKIYQSETAYLKNKIREQIISSISTNGKQQPNSSRGPGRGFVTVESKINNPRNSAARCNSLDAICRGAEQKPRNLERPIYVFGIDCSSTLGSKETNQQSCSQSESIGNRTIKFEEQQSKSTNRKRGRTFAERNADFLCEGSLQQSQSSSSTIVSRKLIFDKLLNGTAKKQEQQGKTLLLSLQSRNQSRIKRIHPLDPCSVRK